MNRPDDDALAQPGQASDSFPPSSPPVFPSTADRTASEQIPSNQIPSDQIAPDRTELDLTGSNKMISDQITEDQTEAGQKKDTASHKAASDPDPDISETVLFDPGLQPERTKLSWSRTLLLLLLVTGAIVKVISAQNFVLAGSLLACSFGFAIFFSMASQRKYARFLNAKSVAADGLLCLLIATYVAMLGSFSLVWILF